MFRSLGRIARAREGAVDSAGAHGATTEVALPTPLHAKRVEARATYWELPFQADAHVLGCWVPYRGLLVASSWNIALTC